MDKRKIRWSGGDLIPLPYESVISCLLRLAWRNVLDERMLQRHFSEGNRKFVLSLPTLRAQTTWDIDEDRARDFDDEQRRGRGAWLSGQFRYCPICLEYGYHSDLHQCICLTACPMHRVPLSTRCHHCNHPTARYAVAKDLFRQPYYCHACGGPIAGVPPSLDAHLDFREISGEVHEALVPYDLWWHSMVDRRRRGHQLRDRRDLQSQWCNSNAFLRSVTCRGVPAPEYIRVSTYDEDDIIVLAWQHRTDHDCPVDAWLRLVSSDRVYPHTAIYRCTLLLLARWLADRRGWGDDQLRDALDGYYGDDVSAYPVDLLAFFCLRWQFEARFACDSQLHISPIEEALIEKVHLATVDSIIQHTAWLAWRAVFLAIYASWHARLTLTETRNLESLRNNTKDDLAYIFMRNRLALDTEINFSQSEGLWFEGEVAFLRVEDMPLAPWLDHGGIAPCSY